MTTEELKNKEFIKTMELRQVQKCNEALMTLALNGYISKWKYKRIAKKLTKRFKKANKSLYENETR